MEIIQKGFIWSGYLVRGFLSGIFVLLIGVLGLGCVKMYEDNKTLNSRVRKLKERLNSFHSVKEKTE